jgi:hypothetical protein
MGETNELETMWVRLRGNWELGVGSRELEAGKLGSSSSGSLF